MFNAVFRTLIKQFVLLLLGTILSMQAIATEFAVIVHPKNTSTFTAAKISRMFLSKIKSFDNGSPVEFYSYDFDTDIRQAFEAKILQKTPQELKSYWTKLVFTGKGSPPHTLGTDAEVLYQVSKNPNGIGYIPIELVTPEVKVVYTY